MKQVQGGNLVAQIEVTGTDEVTEAQRTFNQMTEQLRSQIEEIKNLIEELGKDTQQEDEFTKYLESLEKH